MKLQGARVLLTGAAGGIGTALAALLVGRGAAVLLVGRQAGALHALQRRLPAPPGRVHAAVADIRSEAGRRAIVETAERSLGGIDVLVNNAGVLDFNAFAEADPAIIEQVLLTNLVAPALLTRACLPGMMGRGHGWIVNIGSAFGSLGYPGFATYCASKFGLRGLSEALRRELADTGVGVTYVAPRAVRTALNPDAVTRLAAATRMNVDEPQWVAEQILEALEQGRKTVHLGFPERVFARLNALVPAVVDSALRRQVPTVLKFARQSGGV